MIVEFGGYLYNLEFFRVAVIAYYLLGWGLRWFLILSVSIFLPI
jgi:hypothetical protein